MTTHSIGTVQSVDEPFLLESGVVLPRLEIAYKTYGSLNSGGTNAVLVCHALTGHARAGGGDGWWDGIIGSGKGLDTDRFFIVCSNILGSCYGSTGPTGLNPETGRAYRSSFPQVTVRDMVRAQHVLLRTLGVRQLATVIGGSLGGMQVLEWGILYPGFVRTIIPVATSARHSAWCIGFSEAQRLAIMSDPGWLGGNYDMQPEQGLAVARMIAMISYRSRASFEQRFARERRGKGAPDRPLLVFGDFPWTFQVESYLRYQGEKLVGRFDANSYITLTRAMDLHDVASGRGSLDQALGSICARTLCIGVSSDILYPPEEQKELSRRIPGASYAEIESIHGHDAFLIEFGQMNKLIRPFISEEDSVP